jgi:TctA family transporter
LVFSAIGIYSINNDPFEILSGGFFGIVGFVWMKLSAARRPMLLGFVARTDDGRKSAAGPGHLPRRPHGFHYRPISQAFLIASLLILV